MLRMASFYWRLLRGAPGHVRKIWASGVFWITVALGIIGAFNPLWVTWIKDTWKGISPIWGIGLAATAVVLRIAHENMFAFEQLERELSALKETRPQADLKLVEENDRIYLDIHNPGASAKFRTVLKLKGVNQNPTKNLFAKWNHLTSGGAIVEIAKGTTEQLRLADRVSDGATMRYTVFWGSDGGQSQSLQSANASIITDPVTHNWRVEMALTIIGIPDSIDGPVFKTVFLKGDGTVSLT